jgi:hypothetical protein
MSKITGISYPPDIITRQQQTQTSTDGHAFQNMLDKTLDEKGLQPSEETTASTLSEIRVDALNPVSNCIQSSSDVVVEKTDALLNLLDQYSADLNNPRKNLKEIEAQTLTPDDELHDIATQCAVMANVEYIKFERGDYL